MRRRYFPLYDMFGGYFSSSLALIEAEDQLTDWVGFAAWLEPSQYAGKRVFRRMVGISPTSFTRIAASTASQVDCDLFTIDPNPWLGVLKFPMHKFMLLDRERPKLKAVTMGIYHPDNDASLWLGAAEPIPWLEEDAWNGEVEESEKVLAGWLRDVVRIRAYWYEIELDVKPR